MNPPYIQRAPTKDSTMFHPLRIGPIQETHLLWWTEHVQPTIDTLPERADHGWRWKRILRTAQWMGLGQHIHYFAITIPRPSDEFVLGLVIVAGRYPFLPQPSQTGVLLWFCSTIPQEVLERHLPQPLPKGLGKIAVDIAVTLSFQNNWAGRTGTHAHPDGGEKLIQFYENTCNMQPLSSKTALPTLGRRLFSVNDGRYYYLDETTALQFSQDLTHLRKKE